MQSFSNSSCITNALSLCLFLFTWSQYRDWIHSGVGLYINAIPTHFIAVDQKLPMSRKGQSRPSNPFGWFEVYEYNEYYWAWLLMRMNFMIKPRFLDDSRTPLLWMVLFLSVSWRVNICKNAARFNAWVLNLICRCFVKQWETASFSTICKLSVAK